MNSEKFNELVEKKITNISKKKGFLLLTNLEIYNFDSERIPLNHVVFGKKYIYLINIHIMCN